MQILFSKYTGCGNDFILIDNRKNLCPVLEPKVIQHLCHRTQGIGADGVIFLESSLSANFAMKIFNSDGSEAEMCGNGIRCLMKFIEEKGFTEKNCTIKTMHETIQVGLGDQTVWVEMPVPRDIRWNDPLEIDGKSYAVHYMDLGVPHAILFVENKISSHWMELAPKIRFHPRFSPRGTNVNFAFLEGDSISVKTYERGVEKETQACGTGATATALAAAKIWHLPSPIKILPLSGTPIKISFKISGEAISDVVLSGPAQKIFHGEFVLD